MCNKELYDSISPQAAKWLLPDGTITDKFPIQIEGGTGGGDGESGGEYASRADLDNEIKNREQAIDDKQKQIETINSELQATNADLQTLDKDYFGDPSKKLAGFKKTTTDQIMELLELVEGIDKRLRIVEQEQNLTDE
jgi:archaellum component FlaC